jgi:hypothetical protein
MTVNTSIEAEGLSLWATVKSLVKIAIVAMPALLLWTFLQSLIIPFWLMIFRQMLTGIGQRTLP